MNQKTADKPSFPLAPSAARRARRTVHHGIERSDDFAWLRADNWQEVMQRPEALDGEIRAYLEAENAYTAQKMADTGPLQQRLFEEMKGRIKQDDSTVPAPDGPWAYYKSFVTGGQHPLFCREPRSGGPGQVMIDGDKLAAGHAYFKVMGVDHSPDHRFLAYAADDTGSEYCAIRFRELDTGEDLPNVILNAQGDTAWGAGSRTLYYTRLDEKHRPLQAFRHRLDAPHVTDELIYEEPDAGFFVSTGLTQSRRFIVIATQDMQTCEARLLDAADPHAQPRLIAARERGHEYYVEHHGERLIIMTNADGAEDFKIMEAPLAAPGRENWREIEPHRPGRLILGIAALQDYLVWLEREQGLPRIVIRRWADGAEHAIAFDEEAYALGMWPGYEFDTRILRFTYSSMTTPTQVFDYSMETRERVLRKTQEVPSGHNPGDYITRRVFAPAPDGETVPVTLLYHKTTALDGAAPLLLYGYGSYGYAIPAAFSTECLSLVDRGFAYGIAHIRGGKDKGYRWYREGRGAKKVNTFTDFIAAARYLAAQGFTSPGRIIAQGGSAGGLLMGAVANKAPDLFGGIIAEVPFVDVLATMLDDTLPLTPPEWPEWGNPIASKEDYNTIAAYSPYDNVTAQDYPAILALAGLTDPRVTYWEPAKWVAKLRLLSTGGDPILLKTNMEAGHGGAAGRFDRLKEVALAYAFALQVAGRAGR